jgi:hypothetical protein
MDCSSPATAAAVGSRERSVPGVAGPRFLLALVVVLSAATRLWAQTGRAATPVVDQSQPVVDVNVVTGIGGPTTCPRRRALLQG